MSTLKVDNIRHNSATSDAITMASDGTCTAKLTSVNGGSQLSHRNKARNGAMKISQRGTTFSPTTSTTYLLDGWSTNHGSSGNLDTTVTQSTDAPAGFSKSLKITPDSTLTPSGSQNGLLTQYLEGQDFQDLAFGTSDAKPVTVSWYAKTSATGAGNYTVKVEYNNGTNNYAVNKLFAFTTTWTRYTYTIPATGTATSVGIRDDNELGFRVEYHLFAGPDDVASQFTQWTVNPSPTYKVISGQKNFMDNTNNELYITGFQIEVGDTATSFEHISYGEELRRCERYYEVHWQNTNATNPAGSHNDGYNCICAGVNLGSYSYFPFKYRTQKRAAPSISHGGKFRILGGGSGSNKVADEFYSPSIDGCRIRVAASGTSGQASVLEFDAANNNGEGYIAVVAEL